MVHCGAKGWNEAYLSSYGREGACFDYDLVIGKGMALEKEEQEKEQVEEAHDEDQAEKTQREKDEGEEEAR